MSCSSLEDRQMQTFLEDEFFEQQQPTEWFPIGLDEEGKISFSIPVAIGKICRLIYIFRDIETQEIALIGKTGTSFSSRMSRYKTQFNHPEKLKNKKSRFILAVRENPNRYEFGILYSLHEHESLDEYEKRFVEIRQPIFNQRKGGGGGLVHSSEKKVSYVLPNNPKLLTPEKRFRFQRIGGTIRPEIDLDSHQKMLAVAGKVKGVLYSIREVGTEKRYIGYTTLTDPYTRIRQHCYGSETFFSLSEKFDPTASDGALHPAIGQSPEGFSFGFLPILHDVSELNLEELKEYTVVSNIGEAEKKAIKILQTLVKQGGFNCNGGGGGPISRNLTQEFEEEALKSLN
jgi:hypothetical protein